MSMGVSSHWIEVSERMTGMAHDVDVMWTCRLAWGVLPIDR